VVLEKVHQKVIWLNNFWVILGLQDSLSRGEIGLKEKQIRTTSLQEAIQIILVLSPNTS